MRLAQIARKVKTKPAEIRAFLKDKFELELDKDPNIKLEDDHVNAVLEAFVIEEVIVEEAKVTETVEVEEEIEIDSSIDTDLASLKEAAEEVITSIESVEAPEEKAVETEEIAAAAIEETPVIVAEKANLKTVGIKHSEEKEETVVEDNPAAFIALAVDQNADLIKAEIEKLEGLKVVGKIELEDRETKKLMNEEVSLPTSESIESEIDRLDGDIDTSEFTDLTEDASSDEKDAIFAELDAAMASGNSAKVKKVQKVEVIEEDEDSIYKDRNGIYHFTSEQRASRRKSLAEKASRDKARIQKEKKARHYKENIAPKVKVAPKKKKVTQDIADTENAQKAAKNESKGLWNWINDRN
jgi:hypothetical protein